MYVEDCFFLINLLLIGVTTRYSLSAVTLTIFSFSRFFLLVCKAGSLVLVPTLQVAFW